jgi:hypothetical protein
MLITPEVSEPSNSENQPDVALTHGEMKFLVLSRHCLQEKSLTPLSPANIALIGAT